MVWLAFLVQLIPIAEAILAEIKVLTTKGVGQTEVQKLIALTTYQVEVHQLMALAAQNHLLQS